MANSIYYAEYRHKQQRGLDIFSYFYENNPADDI